MSISANFNTNSRDFKLLELRCKTTMCRSSFPESLGYTKLIQGFSTRFLPYFNRFFFFKIAVILVSLQLSIPTKESFSPKFTCIPGLKQNLNHLKKKKKSLSVKGSTCIYTHINRVSATQIASFHGWISLPM